MGNCMKCFEKKPPKLPPPAKAPPPPPPPPKPKAPEESLLVELPAIPHEDHSSQSSGASPSPVGSDESGSEDEGFTKKGAAMFDPKAQNAETFSMLMKKAGGNKPPSEKKAPKPKTSMEIPFEHCLSDTKVDSNFKGVESVKQVPDTGIKAQVLTLSQQGKKEIRNA